LIGALAAKLPERLHFYSWVLAATVALILTAGAFRAFQYGHALVVMQDIHSADLAGKVALLSVNVIELPEYRRIYPVDNRADFKLSANYLNRKGWLRPSLWDGAFVRKLAQPQWRAEPEFGRVASLTRAGDRLQLAGTVQPAHVVIVLGGEEGEARILGVVFPDGDRWTGEVGLKDAQQPAVPVRCFAYDAASGQAHLLAGGGRP